MNQALLSPAQIKKITQAALKTVLPKTRVSAIDVGHGEFASADLEITVVLASGSIVNLNGKQLSEIQELVSAELWKKGDERFPYVRYLTAQEAKKLAS